MPLDEFIPLDLPKLPDELFEFIYQQQEEMAILTGCFISSVPTTQGDGPGSPRLADLITSRKAGRGAGCDKGKEA